MSTADKTPSFRTLGPRVARTIGNALQKLTNEKIEVKFDGLRTHAQSAVLVDSGEKCFGSCVNFRKPDGSLQGVAAVILTEASTRTLVKLLLRRLLDSGGALGHKVKLSAFKEAGNIVVMACVTEVAKALKTILKTDVPKFVCFRKAEFLKPPRLDGHSGTRGRVSLGQFRIAGPDSVSPIRARLIVIF